MRSCLRCGATQGLQRAHVYPRRFTKLKNDPENLIDLCAECHEGWWHRFPMEAMRWFVERFPEQYAALSRKAGVGRKM